MRLIEVESKVFNPDAIDVVSQERPTGTRLIFRSGTKLTFTVNPNDFAGILRNKLDSNS